MTAKITKFVSLFGSHAHVVHVAHSMWAYLTTDTGIQTKMHYYNLDNALDCIRALESITKDKWRVEDYEIIKS